MKHIGHPLLGDFLYGERSNLINRQALHSSKVQFFHPIYGENVIVKVDMPEDMKKVMV